MVWRFEVWGTKSVAGDFFRPSAQSSGVSRIVNHSAFVPFASSNYRMDDSDILFRQMFDFGSDKTLICDGIPSRFGKDRSAGKKNRRWANMGCNKMA